MHQFDKIKEMNNPQVMAIKNIKIQHRQPADENSQMQSNETHK